VLVSKYCDHLPLNRQTQSYSRSGIELERSTLADWVGGSSRLLDPLVEVLRRYVLTAIKLYADDTPVPVLAPGNGRTKRDDCGRTCGMIARRVILQQQRFGSPTRRIVRANILSGTCRDFVAGCKWTPSLDLIGSIKKMAAFRKSLVGRMFGAAPRDILYLDDRAENVEAAAGLGISSVLFDTVEKTASRVERRFDIPVPSYGRCRQSSSQ
jgi:hypothetical protein